MRKKLVYTLLVLTIAATSLTGCKKKDANIVDNSNETTIETSVSGNDIEENIEKSDFTIETEYVKVADYKGLEIEAFDREITKDDIEGYINFALSLYYSKIDVNGYIPIYTELTDKMVSEITEGEFTKIDEYETYVKDMLEKQAFSDYEEQAKDELFNRVLENSELINYDDEVYNRYMDYVTKSYNQYAEYFGENVEEFYTESLGLESEAEYNDFLEKEALKNIKTEYVIHAIAENEGIIIKDEEVNNEIQNYLNNGYFETEEDLFEYMTREEIVTNLQYYKIRDFIYNNAITE